MTRLPLPLIRVAPLDELRARGVIVVRGADRPIAVFAHNDKVCAVDNRCPHLGFPLSRGPVQDGLLTCPWHHARFDLCSGGTFDLWADDVPAFDTEVRDDVVYVRPLPRPIDVRQHFLTRLGDGLEQDIGLIQAKALLALLDTGSYLEPVRVIARFGVLRRDDWFSGMTILTAMANLVPHLQPRIAFLALAQGARHVAMDCQGQAPHLPLRPLEGAEVPLPTLKRWLRYWTLVRHRDGAERTVLTALASGATPSQMAELLFTAVTDRPYADAGHLLDFSSKAFELLDAIGWEHAALVLPALVPQLARARGGEESNAWRHPVDLIPPLQQVAEELPALLREGAGRTWDEEVALSEVLLGEDPLAILDALRQAIRAGAQPLQLTRVLAHAAALRIARFGTANEFADWITALHTFTYCNALHQAVRRCPHSPDLLRGVFHGAISVYLDRFLNTPAVPLPRVESGPGPEEPRVMLDEFLALLDRRHQVDEAARLVVRYLRQGHPIEPLFDVLTLAVVREDADFHTFQMVEAGIRQYREWQGKPEAEHLVVAMARYLAAHAPTQRAQLQMAEVALRLHRGEILHEGEGE